MNTRLLSGVIVVAAIAGVVIAWRAASHRDDPQSLAPSSSEARDASANAPDPLAAVPADRKNEARAGAAIPSKPAAYTAERAPDNLQPTPIVESDEAQPVAPKDATRTGALTSMRPIFGGTEVIAAAHASTTPEQRERRRQELEETLGQLSGDPKDPTEYASYQSLKDELAWLQDHPK